MTRKKVSKKKVTRKKASTKKARKKNTRRRPVKRKKTAKKSALLRWLKRLLVLSILAGVSGVLLYTIYLSQQVTVKFEGKRWAVPARVYGRPLELYAGAQVTPKQLEAELQRLGYQKQKQPKAPGTWGVTNRKYLVNTRAFDFWDESLPSQSLQISYQGQSISRIVDRVRGREEAILRLEAPMIESIYPSHNEDRILLKRSEIPDLLVQALLAVEDRDFYQHHGINPRSIFRALWANIKAGQVVQGGSTLTQQLVKNFFLSSERTIVRKLNEALMALIVDARYEKDDILEAYANEIYLGQDGRRAIHGFGLGSRFFFNRPLEELDLAKIALMAGIIKGPSYYDPWRHPERASRRRNLVLDILHQQGVISDSELSQAKSAGLGVIRASQGAPRGYPAFIKLVRKQLQRDYREEDLTSEGLRIFTTLDPWVQDKAAVQARLSLDKLEKNHQLPKGKLEVAAVIARPSSGEVLAVLGGRQNSFSGFNRALDAVRPIGSLVKPFVYLAALMQPDKYSLITTLQDESITLELPNGDNWTPANYDNTSHGPVPLVTALSHSYNQATVSLGLSVGLPAVVDVLQKAGVSRPIKAYPSLLLGALSLSPLEVTQVYQTLSAGGFYSSLRTIREVLDHQNQPLQRYPLTVKQALPATSVYLLNNILQTAVANGTGRGLRFTLPVEYRLAGKTGTTNDLRDSWFAGFSSNLVATVWVGRDDNQEAGLTGAQGAMRVWGNIMKAIDIKPLVLKPTADSEYVWIDLSNGLLANENCEQAVQIPFQQGYAPRVESDCVEQSRSFFDRLFD